MSQENVEIVRQFIALSTTNDDLAWELIDPEVVWVIDPPAFLAGTYHGHDGVRTIMSGLAEVFDQFRFEAEELIDAGESVVVLGGFHVRGALSGVKAPVQPWSVVVTLRDGRIATYRAYYRREDALEAVGLRE
jgi:ketosteroid isomerase-like protein